MFDGEPLGTRYRRSDARRHARPSLTAPGRNGTDTKRLPQQAVT